MATRRLPFPDEALLALWASVDEESRLDFVTEVLSEAAADRLLFLQERAHERAERERAREAMVRYRARKKAAAQAEAAIETERKRAQAERQARRRGKAA